MPTEPSNLIFRLPYQHQTKLPSLSKIIKKLKSKSHPNLHQFNKEISKQLSYEKVFLNLLGILQKLYHICDKNPAIRITLKKNMIISKNFSRVGLISLNSKCCQILQIWWTVNVADKMQFQKFKYSIAEIRVFLKNSHSRSNPRKPVQTLARLFPSPIRLNRKNAQNFKLHPFG